MSKLNKGCFTSDSMYYGTPQALFDRLNAEFGFTLDACATPENAKCDSYYTEEQDALVLDWKGTVFMNPPYGRGIGAWVKKAFKESCKGSTVVALVPARTDTKWWHDWVMRAQEIRLIQGRLRFNDEAGPAPFPSAIAVFNGEHDGMPSLKVERPVPANYKKEG